MTNEKDPVREDIVLTHSFLVMSGGNRLTFRETFTDREDDGILTAYEISNIDLSKVDLVVSFLLVKQGWEILNMKEYMDSSVVSRKQEPIQFL